MRAQEMEIEFQMKFNKHFHWSESEAEFNMAQCLAQTLISFRSDGWVDEVPLGL